MNKFKKYLKKWWKKNWYWFTVFQNLIPLYFFFIGLYIGGGCK